MERGLVDPRVDRLACTMIALGLALILSTYAIL